MSTSADGRPARHVIITGVSRGLGAALFDLLLNADARLFAIGRSFTDEQHRMADLRPDRVTLRTADLSDPGRVPAQAELTDFTSNCDERDEVVVIHNAATVEPIGLVGGLEAGPVRDTVMTNLIAPLLLTNSVLAAVPATVQRLRVLYISSDAVARSYPGWATYSATKAGAEAFMRCVGQGATRPCTVEIVDPGTMDTDMHETIRRRGHGLPGYEQLARRYRLGHVRDAGTAARRIFAEHFVATSTAQA